MSEARGSQSAMPLLGAVAVFWGSLRGLGCIAGAVGGVEVLETISELLETIFEVL